MTATGPPTKAPSPLNYHDYYHHLPDVLSSDYATLYAIHHPTNGQPSNVIYKTVVDSADTIPKVFLALVSTPGGAFNVVPDHNPWRYKPSMVSTAPQWDNKVFAFIGDISSTSRFVRTVSFPDDVFDTVAAQSVHPTNFISAAFTAAAPTLLTLAPVTDGTPDTDNITTRAIVPLPHRYVHLALSQLPLSPRAAWTLFATALLADNLAVPCTPLLDWLRVAVTKRFDVNGTTVMALANPLGLLDTAFPPIIDDQQLADRRWAIITRDLPALDHAAPITTALAATHYNDLLSVLRNKRAADCAADDARCLADKQDKLPSETKWLYAALRWMQFTGCASELDRPPIYHRLANCDNKSNHLLLLREAIADCAHNHGAATTQLPVISEETKEMVLSGNFGVPTHDHDDLSCGLQPFAVGLYLGDKLGKTVNARADNYNLMLAGQANPTIKEQATFSTKEIRNPQDLITAGLMLSMTSIQVDVFMGITHPFACAFRTFCHDSWPKIQTVIHLASQCTTTATSHLIRGIMRWIQLEMVNYMDRIMSSDMAIDIPNFTNLLNILHRKQYTLLPPLPNRYRIWTPPTPLPTGPSISPTLATPAPSKPAPAPSTVASKPTTPATASCQRNCQ